MLDLSIIIVSYNTRQLLADCLRSVYEETKGCSFEVIVIDNSSADGSAQYVREHFPHVILQESKENLGFAKANNVAAEEARGQFILLLNPDTVILDHAIDQLLAFARSSPDAKIWGGRTVFRDGSLNATCCYGRATLWSLFCRTVGLTELFRSSQLFNPEGLGGWAYDSERPVDIVTGCFFLIERSFWNELDGFDPHFFIYGDEVDLCIRAWSLGARPMFTPKATIVHYGGASEVSQAVRSSKVVKAKVALMRKHWPKWQQWIGVRLLVLWAFSRYGCAQIGIRCFGKPASAMEKWIHLWRNRGDWIKGFCP